MPNAAYGRNQMDRRAAVASIGPGHTATTERGPPLDRQHSRSRSPENMRKTRPSFSARDQPVIGQITACAFSEVAIQFRLSPWSRRIGRWTTQPHTILHLALA